MKFTLDKKYNEYQNKIKEWVISNITEDDEYIKDEMIEDLKAKHLYGFHTPKAFGGLGKDFLYHVLAINEITKINPKLALSIIKNYIIQEAKLRHGYDNNYEEILNNYEINKSIAKWLLIKSHLSISAYNLALIEKYMDDSDSNAVLLSEIESIKMMIYKASELKDQGQKAKIKSAQAKLLTNELINKYKDLLDENIYEYISNIFNEDLENIKSIITSKENLEPVEIPNEKEERSLERMRIIFDSQNQETNVIKLLEALKNDFYPCFNGDYDIYSDIENSNTVISLGLGIGDRENIDIVEELCKLTCATLGCTLPIAEELEWLPIDRMIGLNGKSFRGHIYLALGLSGSDRHMDTVSDSNIIVAINEDKHAPIFSKCDYGIIGDVNEILPIIIKKLKN